MRIAGFSIVTFLVMGLFTVSAFAQKPVKKLAGDRIVRSLNSTWKFSAEDKPEFAGADVLDDRWQRVTLPHTWNVHDTFDDEPGYRRGPSWYRRDLQLGADLVNKRLYLYFEGANQVAEVYVNTNLVGKHIGGYSAFAYDITDHITLTKQNFVAIRVDNSHNIHIPPLSGDFNMYGGIYRDVWLIATSEVHFSVDDMASSGVQISTPDISAAGSKIRIQGTVSNKSSAAANVEVTSRVLDTHGRQIATAVSKLDPATKSSVNFDHSTQFVAKPRLWSPDDPYLYKVQNVIRKNGKVVDTVTQPLGFRWFSIDAQTGFHLNGKPVKLRGTNRHQDYKGLGNALPDRLHVRDLELIKDAGFNFLRLAHYPQDPAVLNAADRLGLMLWEETPLVNYITDSKEFSENSALMVKEMVRQHRNHPSVIMWGYMNEIFLPPSPLPESVYSATVRLARELDGIARAEDPTRLTTIAFHGNDIYNKHGLGEVAQIVGWNLYNGWYGGVFDDFGKFMDEQHKRYPDRPLIISEYGANGDQRLHSANPRRFDSTMEWQRLFHESHLKQINERPFIAGSAIWNQFDFGAEQRGETIPHLNQKGMYTYDRVPKDIHFFYKANFSKQPVLHVALNDRKHAAGAPKAPQKIDVYLNLDEAELFCNGISLGKKRSDGSTKLSWDVVLRDGNNVLVARGNRNGRTVTDTGRINYRGITTSSPEIAVNVGSNADFVDEENFVWLADQPYKIGSWGFVGDRSKFIYSTPPDRNIRGTLNDPLLQTMQEGLSSYKFDVPDGQYEVELLFTETKFETAGKRVFDVKLNGEVVFAKLDLAKEVGWRRIFTKNQRIRAASGINVEFVPHVGEAVLSGIRIKRD